MIIGGKECMNGIKMILLGIAIILIGGFILVDPQSSFGGYGELAIFVVGLAYCIRGLKRED